MIQSNYAGGSEGKESACNARDLGSESWLGKIPWRREWQPTSVFCLENSVDRGIWWATIHGVQQESDTTERPIHTHISKNALAFVAVL